MYSKSHSFNFKEICFTLVRMYITDGGRVAVANSRMLSDPQSPMCAFEFEIHVNECLVNKIFKMLCNKLIYWKMYCFSFSLGRVSATEFNTLENKESKYEHECNGILMYKLWQCPPPLSGHKFFSFWSGSHETLMEWGWKTTHFRKRNDFELPIESVIDRSYLILAF